MSHSIIIKIATCFSLLTFFLPVWSKTTKKVPTAEEILEQGRSAFFNYEFDEAADLYNQYKTLQAKAKQPEAEELEIWEDQLSIASGAFERVQNIVVIDSLNVPQKDFFKAYRLQNSAGEIIKDREMLSKLGMKSEFPIFISQNHDYVLSSSRGENGEMRLFESNLLLDDSWESREILEGDFEKEGNYIFPFMSSDGQTLYFANDGEESMGGYDIFVAQKEPITGEYRQPLNMGMPFNSPYNEYLLAIDEEQGIGWWATDRNAEDGFITIYIYLLDEIRKNYPSDTDNLKNFAKISDYKSTWETGKEEYYKSLIPR